MRAANHLVRNAFDLLLDFVEFAAHEALDRINRVARVGDGLPFGGVADQAFAGFVKATTEGVTRLPSEFSSTSGSPPSMTAMQEFVVPKSIPNYFCHKKLLAKHKADHFKAGAMPDGCEQYQASVSKYDTQTPTHLLAADNVRQVRRIVTPHNQMAHNIVSHFDSWSLSVSATQILIT